MNPVTAKNRNRLATPHRALSLAIGLGCLLSIGSAHAQDALPEATKSEASTHYAVGVQAYAGAVGTPGKTGMPLVGVSLLGRYGMLEGGLLYEGATELYGTQMTGTAGLLGVGYDATPHLRFSLLSEIGFHQYTHVGGELLGQPGSNGNLAYGGGRAGFQYGFGGDVRFTIGAWLFVRDDFGRKTESVTYNGWLDGAPSTATNQIGAWQTGLVLRLGIEGGSF